MHGESSDSSNCLGCYNAGALVYQRIARGVFSGSKNSKNSKRGNKTSSSKVSEVPDVVIDDEDRQKKPRVYKKNTSKTQFMDFEASVPVAMKGDSKHKKDKMKKRANVRSIMNLDDAMLLSSQGLIDEQNGEVNLTEAKYVVDDFDEEVAGSTMRILGASNLKFSKKLSASAKQAALEGKSVNVEAIKKDLKNEYYESLREKKKKGKQQHERNSRKKETGSRFTERVLFEYGCHEPRKGVEVTNQESEQSKVEKRKQLKSRPRTTFEIETEKIEKDCRDRESKIELMLESKLKKAAIREYSTALRDMNKKKRSDKKERKHANREKKQQQPLILEVEEVKDYPPPNIKAEAEEVCGSFSDLDDGLCEFIPRRTMREAEEASVSSVDIEPPLVSDDELPTGSMVTHYIDDDDHHLNHLFDSQMTMRAFLLGTYHPNVDPNIEFPGEFDVNVEEYKMAQQIDEVMMYSDEEVAQHHGTRIDFCVDDTFDIVLAMHEDPINAMEMACEHKVGLRITDKKIFITDPDTEIVTIHDRMMLNVMREQRRFDECNRERNRRDPLYGIMFHTGVHDMVHDQGLSLRVRNDEEFYFKVHHLHAYMSRRQAAVSYETFAAGVRRDLTEFRFSLVDMRNTDGYYWKHWYELLRLIPVIRDMPLPVRRLKCYKTDKHGNPVVETTLPLIPIIAESSEEIDWNFLYGNEYFFDTDEEFLQYQSIVAEAQPSLPNPFESSDDEEVKIVLDELKATKSAYDSDDDLYNECTFCGSLMEESKLALCVNCTPHARECRCHKCRNLMIKNDNPISVENVDPWYQRTLEAVKRFEADHPYIINGLDHVLKVAALIDILYRSENFDTDMSAIYLYASTFVNLNVTTKAVITSLGTGLIVSFRAIRAAVKEEIVAEGFSDEVLSVKGAIGRVYDASVVSSLRKLVAFCLSSHMIPKNYAEHVYGFVGQPEVKWHKCNWIQVSEMILDTIASISHVAESMMAGYPFTKALFAGDPVDETVASATDLLRWKDRLYDGIYHPGQKDRKDFRREAQQHVDFLKVHLQRIKTTHKMYGTWSRLASDLELAIADIDAAAKANSRIPPVCIMLQGESGVGKSSLRKAIYMLFMKVVKGQVFNPSHVYSKQLSSDFWEGYKDQYIVGVSELGNEAKNIAEKQAIRFYSELCSLADAEPYLLDMAFEGKGKTYCLADLILCDSNSKTLNLEYQITNVGAWWRRFMRIVPYVKPQYCKPGTSEIDPSRIPDDMYVFDCWYFDVFVFQTLVATKEIPIQLLRADQKHDIYDLYQLLTTHFTRHFTVNAAVKAKIDQAMLLGPVERPILADNGGNDVKGDEPIYPTADVNVIAAEGKDGMSVDDIKEHIRRLNIASKKKIISPGKQWYNKIKTKCADALYNGSIGATLFFDFALNYVKDEVASSVKKSAIIAKDRETVVSWSPMRLIFFLSGLASLWSLPLLFFVPLSWFPFISFVNYDYIMKSLIVQRTVVKKEETTTSLRLARAAWKTWWDSANWIDVWPNPVRNSYLKLSDILAITGFGIAATGAMYTLKQAVSSKKRRRRPVAEGQNYVPKDTKELETLLDISGTGGVIMLDKESMHYNTVRPLGLPAHTGDLDSLHRRVYKNVRWCIFSYVRNGANRLQEMHCLGLKGNFLLCNSHAVPEECDKFKIRVAVNSKSTKNMVESQLTTKDFVRLGNDLMLVRISGLSFNDITAHLNQEINFPDFATGRIGNEDTVITKCPEVTTVKWADIELKVDDVLQYRFNDHKIGACGLPLLHSQGQGFVIGAIHGAGMTGSDRGFGMRVYKQVVCDHISKWKDVLHEIVSESSSEMVLIEPHPKSVFQFEDAGSIEYHGRIPGPILAAKKSAMVRMVPDEVLDPWFKDVFGHAPTEIYGKPKMMPFWREEKNGTKTYVSLYNNAIRKMSCNKVALDRNILRKVVDVYSERIIAGLRAKGVKKMSPATFDVAINGSPTNSAFDRINVSTSGGFGFPGSKSRYLPIYDVRNDRLTRSMTPELEDKVLSIYGKYLGGETSGCFFNVCPKDEPRLLDKIADGKVRLFMAMSLDHVIVCRQMFGEYLSYMSLYPEIFGCSIGINMYTNGYRIHDMMDGMVFEGDFSAYDQTMPFDVSWACSSIIIRVLKEFGYNREAIIVLDALFTDLLFPHLVMLNDVFTPAGIQPSGSVGTAQLNSMKNLILKMYFWYSTPELREKYFFDFIKCFDFGDDSLENVRKEVSTSFNCLTFSKFCKEHYGMSFTSSSKDECAMEFVDKKDMSLLKRTFVHHSACNRIVCPLSPNSIYKMLQWMIPSKVESPEVQILSTITSAMTELFFHCDEEQYNRSNTTMREWYMSVAPHCAEMYNKLVPKYSELVLKFRHPPVSHDTSNEVCGGSLDTVSDRCLIDDLAYLSNAALCVSAESIDKPRPAMWSAMQVQNLIRRIYEVESDIKEVEGALVQRGFDVNGRTLHDIVLSKSWSSDFKFREQYKDVVNLLAKRDALNVTLNVLHVNMARCKNKIQSESAETDDFTVAESEEWMRMLALTMTACELVDKGEGKFVKDMNGVVYFMNKKNRLKEINQFLIKEVLKSRQFTIEMLNVVAESTEMDAAPVITQEGNLIEMKGDNYDTGGEEDKDMMNAQATFMSLDKFVERYATVFDYDIPLGTNTALAIPVWDLYTKLQAFRSKAKNYAYARFDLDVKIRVVGTPFHIGGLLIASYPAATLSGVYSYISSLGSTFYDLQTNYFSNIPGHKYMNVNEEAELEIEMPYILPKPYMRLFNNSTLALGAATSFDDIVGFQHLIIRTLFPPAAIGAPAASKIALTVFVRPKNVKLTQPTATVMELVAESCEIIAESDERVAGPVEKAASASASFASMFRMVPVIGPYARASEGMANALSHFAALFGWSTSNSIRDPEYVKNEPYRNGVQTIGMNTDKRFTFDPKQGLNVDPRIVNRDQDELSIAWLCRQPSLLTITNWTPDEVPLIPIMTIPVHPNVCGRFSGNYQPTNVSNVARLFKVWHGSITYHFRVYKNHFMKGTLLIYYEPNAKQNALITTSLNLQKNCIGMLDLSTEDEISFTVEYAREFPWAEVLFGKENCSIDEQTTANAELWNGAIYLVPMTYLTSNSTEGARIAIEVSSNDMRFNGFDPVWCVDRQIVAESSETLNPMNMYTDHLTEHYFGEQPVSLRSYMKRFMPGPGATVTPTASANGYVHSRFRVVPQTITPMGNVSIPGRENLISYLKQSFLGLRGGMRFRWRLRGGSYSTRPFDNVSVQLSTSGTESFGFIATLPDYTETNAAGRLDFQPTTNSGIEFEVPFYASTLWLYGYAATGWSAGMNMHSFYDTVEVNFYGQQYATTAMRIDTRMAAGEDFTLFGYISPPPFKEV